MAVEQSQQQVGEMGERTLIGQQDHQGENGVCGGREQKGGASC